MPNPLPLPMMFKQRLVMLFSSVGSPGAPELNVAGMNAVSVTANVPATGVAWIVVPQASMPLGINVAAVTNAALLVQFGVVP